VCKHEWVSSADNIMRGKGCASCAGQLNITNEYVDEKLKINNPKIVRIGNIINCKILCEFKCIECNHIWKAIPQNVYRNKHTSGCPKCLYKRERYVHDVILKHIPTTFVKYQHKIKDNLSNFIVDFYIFINNKNIFIEYNGEQHYRPFRFKNKDYVDIFEKQVKRDKLLREYCIRNNIILIELPYKLTNEEIEKIIIDVKNNNYGDIV
jgi:hypothetical protein